MIVPTTTTRRLKGKSLTNYLDLVKRFPLLSIRTDEELDSAIKVIDELLKIRDPSQAEELYLDALSDLVKAYEDIHHPIGPAPDHAMLQHLMEARGVTQAEISRGAKISKSSISEILSGKKPFSKTIIRKLAEFFNVDVSVLSGNLGK